MEASPEISVILPVYNVADYLDICMESIEAQTFSDFEVIMINDGSTDGSADKCRKWQAQDPRIRFVDKDNEGVAAARNLGVDLSMGEYIAFVDPDDWLDPTYLEKLRKPLAETDASFSECDLWRYDNRTGKKIYRCCYGQMGRPYTLREHMKYAPTATYKSMSRRSLWEKWKIRMPDCTFESPAVYSLIVALSGKVESVREPLYYYRRFRENSLIENGYAAKDGTPNKSLGVEAMAFLMEEFKRCGIYEKYSDDLEGIIKYRLNDILAMQFHRRSAEDFAALVESHRHFLAQAFPKTHNEPYLSWGGYNLNRILTHMNWLHDPSCRFSFSSIISICGEPVPVSPEIEHKNSYRREMLKRERQQTFWQKLEELKPSYLFLDLVEERFDVIDVQGRYLTKSDAYDGLTKGRADGSVIDRFSPDCTDLWMKCAQKFVQRIRKISPDTRPVIVETLLCENVGDVTCREPFSDLGLIRKMNHLLSDYYQYLASLWPDAVVIRLKDDPLWFTDSKYEYGAIPAHMNELLNQEVAKRVEQML